MTDGSPGNNQMGAVAEIIGSAHSDKRPPNRDTAEEMQDVGSKGESSMTMSCPKERERAQEGHEPHGSGWLDRPSSQGLSRRKTRTGQLSAARNRENSLQVPGTAEPGRN